MQDNWTGPQREFADLLPRMKVGDWWQSANITKDEAKAVAESLQWALRGWSLAVKQDGKQVVILRTA